MINFNVPMGASNMEAAYQRAIDDCLEYGKEQKWKALKLMHDGGECPICSKPFQKMDCPGLSPVIPPFIYFMPACHCFWTCPRCKAIMIEEGLMNQAWCFNCQEPPKEKGSRRSRAHSVESGKDAAAGKDK